MDSKIKVAVNWAGACGGCDVALVDLENVLLDVADLADFVYWPVAIDFKREDFQKCPNKSVDIGLFNGAVRTSEQLEDARLMRKKCKVLFAFGSCACFGGIPGLANSFNRDEILSTVYKDTASTINKSDIFPLTESTINGLDLTLPEFFPRVYALQHVVPVEYFVPGCPAPMERVLDLVELLKKYGDGAPLPAKGSTLASDKALCDECPRCETKQKGLRIENVVRPHEILIDESKCFLDQGIICMGPATRGGCCQTCLNANMPCRGCFGPIDSMVDQGADAITAIAALLGSDDDYKPQQQIPKQARELKDPLGTFYRFSLACSLLSQRVDEDNK